jgi:hypothetical protein
VRGRLSLGRLRRPDLLWAIRARLRSLRHAIAKLQQRRVGRLVCVHESRRVLTQRPAAVREGWDTSLRRQLSVGSLRRPSVSGRSLGGVRQLRVAIAQLRCGQRSVVGVCGLHRRRRVRAELYDDVRPRWHADLRWRLSLDQRVLRSNLRRRWNARLRQLRHANAHLRSQYRCVVRLESVQRGRSVFAEQDARLRLGRDSSLRW